jgi:hypothetical protein
VGISPFEKVEIFKVENEMFATGLEDNKTLLNIQFDTAM